MKINLKILCFSLAILFLVSSPGWALNTPGVVEDHGVITALITSDAGLTLGAEYGLTSQFALMGEVNGPTTRIGGKYEVASDLALLMGVTDDSPFLGINGSYSLDPDLTGIYEFNLSSRHNDLSVLYKFGGSLAIDQNLALRAGLVGFLTEDNFPDLQLGIGYKF